ncbi:oxygen-insensitive NADPH nitroreductase [Aliagarivorans taiwanensis]|uniref:oxygen-insensitive NADPH nitroreductase n=1 Tax=Aliagarivorans taiwanensis TaxID=561966 RepID=UPI000403AB4B|nr:oxygen-insensitive NADPH nitroreductase [Aliagarivorans taiwanensis]
MTPVIQTIKQHRSIRQFTEQAIEAEMLDAIITSGIAASSSSLLQAVSIIRVSDSDKRTKLAELAGNQAYVASAAEFLVFCIDFQRHHQFNSEVQSDFTELTLIGAIDAGIMAQNCLLAAESLGLGGVYIGGLRNAPQQVDELLGLPQHCAILFGLCLGHPAQDPELKPRLSPQVLVHQDSYQSLDKASVARYDQAMREYYQARSSNTKQQGWSEQVGAKLSKETRPFMRAYLNGKGLAKR